MRYLIVLNLFLVLCSAKSKAACPSFFDRVKSVFFGAKITVVLPDSVARDLKNFRAEEFPISKRVNFSSPSNIEFGFLLAKLPKSVIDFVSKLPVTKKHVHELKLEIYKQNEALKNSILANVLEGLHFYTIGLKEGTFTDLINRKIEEFENVETIKKKEVEALYNEGILISKANKNWESNYFEEIKVLSESGKSISFKIGDKTYEGKIVEKRGGKFVIFNAPKEMLRHPAWNPLDHQYIAELASTPGFKGKDFYPVDVGLRGELYLLDGNHRSIVDPRAKLPAELPYPMRTSNLRNYLDLIGRPQPTTSQKIEILNGTLDPYSFLIRPSY